MPATTANGITIEFETFGDRRNPALLLVMGLGGQMIGWDEAFCQQIAGEGFYTIRYDNRDVGLSSKIEDGPAPNLAAAMAGDTSSASYLLSDMAADGIALLSALDLERAHIAGASMGGMIVQSMAINHPDRLLSLCSIMSTTGSREVGQARPEAMAMLTRPPARNREEAIEAGVASARVLGSPGFPFDEVRVRERSARAYDRCFYPVGFARQMLAIIASGDRTEGLRGVRLPTVVIHGDADPLVTPSGGEATAKAVPGADLVTIPGMGHDLPQGAWDTVIGSLTKNARRAGA